MYIANPLSPSQFGEMGKRVEVMRDWIATKSSIESQMDLDQIKDTSSCIEEAVVAAFPFIHNPTGPLAQESLENLRKRYVPNSKGIVIPTGKGTFRFACHLVSSLRDVLSSELPIQIVYAGDEDLPEDYRYLITRLGSRIEALDITKVLDDKTLQLAKGGWAIKAFAALASTFEQVLVLDADAVFIQKPEVILNNHKGYKETGSLLFHDRLLWQGAFKERHEWWEKEMKGHVASGTLNKSKVYNDRYAEEGDSGVVALDKSRLPIFMGLLHICWQNTLAVREAWTYRMGYGDKESWWFGLELSGANYTFEDHYGSIVGDERTVGTSKKVCSFTIAHLDREDKLLWYNGSLLKNKAINKLEFEVPSHWMVDGVWEKGATKPDISCMRDGVVRNMTNEEKEILTASVKVAKQVDQKIKHLVDL
ncbi:hypothetical protein MMC19_001089 [Ptychographa xylographoides]|nr:hypothetical protein [Ptychographa xylographoides]